MCIKWHQSGLFRFSLFLYSYEKPWTKWSIRNYNACSNVQSMWVSGNCMRICSYHLNDLISSSDRLNLGDLPLSIMQRIVMSSMNSRNAANKGAIFQSNVSNACWRTKTITCTLRYPVLNFSYGGTLVSSYEFSKKIRYQCLVPQKMNINETIYWKKLSKALHLPQCEVRLDGHNLKDKLSAINSSIHLTACLTYTFFLY